MPNFECPDGVTIAGPGDCKRNEEGICAWEIIECPAECTAGEKREATDGCNTCECTEDGTWACTEEACPPSCGPDDCGPPLGMPNYECPDGETMAGPGDCVLTEDGQCGWEIIECPPECAAGEKKDADDGCNTCECTEEGTWACTDMACPKECGDDDCGPALGMPNYLCPDGVTMAGPGDCILQEDDQCGWEIVECPAECTVGETKDAGDGCNTCECTEDGTWACTEMICPACEVDDCGPKPGIPNKLCADGKTMSGPGDCVEQKDGSCAWEIIECPDECPPFKCPPGQMPLDTDNDGCNDSCKGTSICPPFKCPAGETPVDTDDDGCNDSCEPKIVCPPFTCPTGEAPVDTDKDGCNDSCEACTPIACLKGQKQVDTDNDGCPDKCYSDCTPMGLCPMDQWPADTDGDGCPDQCVPKGTCQTVCDCYDSGATFPKPCNASCEGCGPYWTCSKTGTCAPACGPIPDEVQLCSDEVCPPILCEDGAEPMDLSGNGCPETCVPSGSMCTPGDSQPADDGCNTCICMNDGQWACTKMLCPSCPPPAPPTGDGCAQVIAYAKHPVTGECCQYGNPCVTPKGWDVFLSMDACENAGGCMAGEEKPAGDGCNTCTCDANGKWACTDMACGAQCQPGDTKEADDGCNTCICMNDGQWACTKKLCIPECPPPKAFEGNCAQVIATAINPQTGQCCEYPTPCNIPDGWDAVIDPAQCSSKDSGGKPMPPTPNPSK